ncbi:unnamed protein product [marine sediment metagenome]|uniref:Uncharacterized protein n=1 Tax=marine sediment metagenome TaxID=412755 RepID=X0UKM7_9ZZZZ
MQELIDRKVAKIAFDNHQHIINLKSHITKSFLELAFFLKNNHDKKYYQVLGYDHFEEYLGTPEIGLSRSYAFKLIKVYEVWVEKYNIEVEKLQDIDVEKLYIATTLIKGEDYEERLEQARTLSRSDLRSFTSGGYKRYNVITCPYCKKMFEIKKGEE